MGSVALLAATGLYPALVQIPSIAGLIETEYGVTLLIKLWLILPLVLLGAVDQVVIGPRLRRGEPVAVWLQRAAGGGRRGGLAGGHTGGGGLADQPPPGPCGAAVPCNGVRGNYGEPNAAPTHKVKTYPV